MFLGFTGSTDDLFFGLMGFHVYVVYWISTFVKRFLYELNWVFARFLLSITMLG